MFAEIIGTLSFLQPQPDDDFADRLNYYYTSTVLIVTAILVSFKMFGGRPLECWVPAEYTSSWEDYSEMFCWARNTYWASFDDNNLPSQIQKREDEEISYYQWTPFFLVLAAFMFYFPCIVWRATYPRSGISLRDITAIAGDKTNVQPEVRNANLQGLATHLQSILSHQFKLTTKGKVPGMHRVMRCLNLPYYGAYMTLVYLIVKFLYLLNVVGQLFLMNLFLQTDDYTIYGFSVLKDLFYRRPWQHSGNFPRVTMCDMQIRVLGNVQRHTVQCVLVINIFTEKIFIGLWFWYGLLTLVTLVSFIYWMGSVLFASRRLRFVTRCLELADKDFNPAHYKYDLKKFALDVVKMDGVFVLEMITIHTGIIFCTELVDTMWDQYCLENGIVTNQDQHKQPALKKVSTGHSSNLATVNEEEDESENGDGHPLDALIPPASPRYGSPPHSPEARPILKRKDSAIKPLVVNVPPEYAQHLASNTKQKKRFLLRSQSTFE